METGNKTGILKIILRCVILAIVAVIILFVVINYQNIRFDSMFQFITGGDGGNKTEAKTLSFAPDAANTFEAYQDGMAVLNQTGLSVIGSSGEERLSQKSGYSRPAMKSAGDYLLAYDIGGTSLLCIKDAEIKNNYKFDSEILTADLNSSGWLLIVDEESGSKATASVFDDNKTERYKWYSSERYITCAALNGDSTGMAIGGLRQENARIISSVVMLRFDTIDKEEPFAVIDLQDVLILDMKYLSDGSLAVLTENSVLVIGSDGKERGRYEFDGKMLKEYTFGGDGYILLRLSKNGVGETSEVLLLNYEAKVVKTLTLNGILSLDCKGKFAGILTSDHIIVYNSNLEEQYTSTISAGSKKLLMREDGAALVLSSAEALIFR
jgi:hypothetical protein